MYLKFYRREENWKFCVLNLVFQWGWIFWKQNLNFTLKTWLANPIFYRLWTRLKLSHVLSMWVHQVCMVHYIQTYPIHFFLKWMYLYQLLYLYPYLLIKVKLHQCYLDSYQHSHLIISYNTHGIWFEIWIIL